jgi:hypothetical protein
MWLTGVPDLPTVIHSISSALLIWAQPPPIHPL